MGTGPSSEGGGVHVDYALEPRAEHAVRFGIVDAPAAQRWLGGFTELVNRGAFIFTVNVALGVEAQGFCALP